MVPAEKSRILIVDDEETLAFFLKQSLLRNVGEYTVETVTSGEEALSRIEQYPYDLIMADLRLPGMNGLELIAHVRERLPHAHTILMTAYGNDAVEEEARRLQVFRYVTKPFRLPEIAATVKEALEKLAVSRQGVLVLSDDRFEAVIQVLETLRQELEAQCILVADAQGQLVTSVGFSEGIDLSKVTSLIAAGFASSFGLMHYLGQQDARNLSYFEGGAYDIYSANVGDNLFLTLVFGKKASLSRIGTVWFYTKRVVTQLLEMLATGGEGAGTSLTLDSDFALDLPQALEEGAGSAPPLGEGPQDVLTGAALSPAADVAGPPATQAASRAPAAEPVVAPPAPPSAPIAPSADRREQPAEPGPRRPAAPSPSPSTPAAGAVPAGVQPPAGTAGKRPTAAPPPSAAVVPPQTAAADMAGAASARPSAAEPGPAGPPPAGTPAESFPHLESAPADEDEGRMSLEEAWRRGLVSDELYRQLTGE